MSEIQEVSQKSEKEGEVPQEIKKSFVQQLIEFLTKNSIFVVSILIAVIAFFFIKKNEASQVLNDSFVSE